MPTILDEDIIGYLISGEIVCRRCTSYEEERVAKLEDLLLESNCNDGKHRFCSRCEEPIN